MAVGLETPVDSLTNIPLPLLTTHEPAFAPVRKPDLHHAFHPRRSPELQGIAGLALRECRVQVTKYYTHHNEYHHEFYGPPLPQTDEEKFQLVVLAAAGYIPEQAITFGRDSSPHTVHMPAYIRERMWKTNRIHINNLGYVKQFLQGYVLDQDLSSINESTIDEFLHTQQEDRRWELGCEFLGVGVRQATEPLKELYKEAKGAAYLPPERARTASRFVLGSLGMRRQRKNILEAMRNKFLPEPEFV